MTNLLFLIAIIVFVVGAVIGFIRRDWAPALIATGLAVVTLAQHSLKL